MLEMFVPFEHFFDVEVYHDNKSEPTYPTLGKGWKEKVIFWRVPAMFCCCQIWVYDAEDTDEYECVALLQSHSQDWMEIQK